VIITKLQVAPVELDVSSQSSSTCRASRARRVEPVERVELCSSTSSTQPNAWARHVECVESSQVEFEPYLNRGATQKIPLLSSFKKDSYANTASSVAKDIIPFDH